MDEYKDRNETRDALDQRITHLLDACGYLCVPVPNALGKTGKTLDWIDQLKPDAILLSGGNNIGDYPERDSVESTLISYAEKNKMPLLGICRGMQMIGHHYGAELRAVSGHVRSRHMLTGDVSREVNSYHDYALENLPAELKTLSSAADGTIEHIRHKTLPIEGWMWHPEREEHMHQEDIKRIKELFI